MPSRRMIFCLWGLLVGLALASGCGDDQAGIRSYTVDKPGNAPSQGASLPADHPGMTAGNNASASNPSVEIQPVFEVPEAWPWQSGRNDFGGRATYTVPGSEGVPAGRMAVSIAQGTMLVNINRWRTLQLGLERINEVTPDMLETIACPAGDVYVIDLQSSADASGAARRFRIGMLADMQAGLATGQTWFFKLQGSPEVVAANAQRFDAMLAAAHWPDEEPPVQPESLPEDSSQDPAAVTPGAASDNIPDSETPEPEPEPQS